MKKYYLVICSIFTFSFLSAQISSLTIPAIQGNGNSSAYTGKTVKTNGIVTAKYIGTGMINGFFIQDATGDGDPNTSDGIFVSTTTDNVSVGDKIEVTATVNENSNRTQLSNISSLTILSHNNPLPVQKITYDIYHWDWEKYEGMLVEFQQTLWVNSNAYLAQYGELELGIKRKPSPTNVVFPSLDSNSAYSALVNENSLLPIYLDDARTSTYVSPIVFADENGTRRTGERIDNFRAIVDYTNSKYVLYPAQFPVNFYGNPRKNKPDSVGNYNLKVCAFNLEYYLTTPNSSLGPSNQQEVDRQHTKILNALLAINADIYGLVEIEMGQQALSKLSQGLNAATGTTRYAYIDDGTSVDGTYTKVGYLYRTDKVTPFNSLKNINSPTPANRKKLQAFTLKSNNEKFIFSINHFKAKSGCPSSGVDADQGDGQSCYNATRVNEANAVISAISTNKAYYGDEDALVMGDLNAYAKEDPVQAFIKAGFTDLHQQFHADSAYSYVFRGEAGYLDQALANESLAKQITGVTAFHINADEPTIFEYSGTNYQPNMFRCSDHDPVIVGMRLGEKVNANTLPFEEKVKIYPTIVETNFKIKNAQNAYIQVFGLNGVKVFQDKINSSEEEFSIDQLKIKSGAYIIRVLGESTIVSQILLVK